MAQSPERQKPWRARAGAIIAVGSLLGMIGLLVVRASEQEQRARERARWEAEREQLNRDLQRLETQFRQLQERQKHKKEASRDNGEWLCDRVPCNQGDLIERPKDAPKSPFIDQERQQGPVTPPQRPAP